MTAQQQLLKLIAPYAAPYVVALPYQDVAADYNRGYCTAFQSATAEITGASEDMTTDGQASVESVARLSFQVSLYRRSDVLELETAPDVVASRIRSYLKSSRAVTAFYEHGLDLGPVWDDLRIDNYLDSTRKFWVRHAHFDVMLYVTNAVLLEDNTLNDIILEVNAYGRQ